MSGLYVTAGIMIGVATSATAYSGIGDWAALYFPATVILVVAATQEFLSRK